MEKKLKCVQCDSENIDIIEIEEELVCQDCGAHMIYVGEDEYILHISNRDEWRDLFEEPKF